MMYTVLYLQVVREGDDVVLSCKAGGHPAPNIKWRREDGQVIRQGEYHSCIGLESICLPLSPCYDRNLYFN